MVTFLKYLWIVLFLRKLKYYLYIFSTDENDLTGTIPEWLDIDWLRIGEYYIDLRRILRYRNI